MGRLEGKVAVVTGANSGIGLPPPTRQRKWRPWRPLQLHRSLVRQCQWLRNPTAPEITEEHYERTFATNVKGTLFTVRKALPLLRYGASIIRRIYVGHHGNTSVQRIKREQSGNPRVRARPGFWIWRRGVSVSMCWCRGRRQHPDCTHWSRKSKIEKCRGCRWRPLPSLGRLGEPDEIGGAALFLASDESSFMNGSELFVDSGAAQI